MPVTKLLIANRGEIACRIMRTCRELEIPTVAVYSDSDRAAMHVRLAILSYPVGPTPARESYMRVDKIIEACRKTGADAVHPGYGFLAEDPDAARQIIEAGLTWVGPAPEVLERMNNKITAREVAASVGCPVLPGIQEILDDEALLDEARKVGYPLMVKPVLGRDGKGMRLVKTAGDLRRALPRVKGDAIFSFWDERVYLEKALIHPRHIEVQVAADQHGNCIHLWEREGSVQRRFQQLCEEAPSPAVSPELRARLGDLAVRIAKAAGFVGVGTVEFLLDQDGNPWFLEMTCRIQGGHAVTEWITGQDLVKWQLDIAQGRELPLRQDQVPLWGHAIQCRINAEDPDREFAPSSGRIQYLRSPQGHNLRNDSGVYFGWDLSPFYAPLVAKISTWGQTRQEALARMHSALMEMRLGGVRNNIAFFRQLLEHKQFISGDLHTGILDHAWWKQKAVGPNLKFAVAAALFDELEMEERRAQQPTPRSDCATSPAAWKSHSKFNRF
ncbi:MAG TPA: biotin carboxylase N-terminal domain-containing protein [Holophaga sp.]|nr:biotin carboxylase N-terminal domain-containing protein [Holophaga sp.]